MNADIQQNPEPLVADPSAEEFFFRNAQKRGQTLQEGEHGFALQEAAKARAEGASLAERLADPPSQDAAPQESQHPSLRVPDSALGYQLPAGVEREEAETVGGWFRSAELPVTAGRFIAEAAVATAREPMTDAALSLATRSLHNDLKRSWGQDYRSNLDAVTAEINRVDQLHNGKLWAWLDERPCVLTSPHVIKAIASNLQRKRR